MQNSRNGRLYAKWEPDATGLVSALTRQPTDCTATVGPQGWVAPVKAPIVSGFRTPEQPGHDGVDLGAPPGTAIHAASTGAVTVATCSVSAGTCNQPGSPQITGCG